MLLLGKSNNRIDIDTDVRMSIAVAKVAFTDNSC